MAATRIPQSRAGPALALVLLAAGALAAFLVPRADLLDKSAIAIMLDCIAATVFIGLLLSRRFDDAPPGHVLRWRGVHALSSLSYSLYAAHTPVAIFLFAIARRVLGPTPSAPELIAATLAIFVATLLVARLFWGLTEAHTGAIRTAARRALAPGSVATEGAAG